MRCSTTGGTRRGGGCSSGTPAFDRDQEPGLDSLSVSRLRGIGQGVCRTSEASAEVGRRRGREAAALAAGAALGRFLDGGDGKVVGADAGLEMGEMR